MSTMEKEKERFLLSIKLYEQYRHNRVKKYRKNNIKALHEIIHSCSDKEDLERRILCYSNIHIKSGLIIFGYCIIPFGKSVLKESLMSVMTTERLKRKNKILEEKIEKLNEEKKGFEEKAAMLMEECSTLREEGGELQLCINNLRKEKAKLYGKLLDLMDKLKGYINQDDTMAEKKTVVVKETLNVRASPLGLGAGIRDQVAG